VTAATERESWIDMPAEELRLRLEAPRLAVFDVLPSTMDVAHSLAAEGAGHGTIVLAEVQTSGRGRLGRHWVSGRGDGIWLSMILRPPGVEGLGVLSLRSAIGLARALEPLADGRVGLKWPNDLYVGGRKLAGVLSEARWRGAMVEWVVVGVGVNLRRPSGTPAAALRSDVEPVAALTAVVRALGDAAARWGDLTVSEMAEWAARDVAAGRRCVAPEKGTVVGVSAEGELIVDVAGERRLHRGGSLVLEEDS
jgi:BirA family transcriptional regulator, biotin operon repressor / biotin---[acetyl-CoA-carboxylase] ligase